MGLFTWYQQRALVLVYPRLQDISDKVRFSNFKSQQQLSKTNILSDFEVLLALQRSKTLSKELILQVNEARLRNEIQVDRISEHHDFALSTMMYLLTYQIGYLIKHAQHHIFALGI